MTTYKKIALPIEYDQRDNSYSPSSTCFPTSVAIVLATIRSAGGKMPVEWRNGAIDDKLLDDLKEYDSDYRRAWADKGPMNCRYFSEFYAWYFKSIYNNFFETQIGKLPEATAFRAAKVEQLLTDDWLLVVGTVIDVAKAETSGHRRVIWGVDRDTNTVAVCDPWGIDASCETPEDYLPYDVRDRHTYWKHLDDVEVEHGNEVSWLWSGSYLAIRSKQNA